MKPNLSADRWHPPIKLPLRASGAVPPAPPPASEASPLLRPLRSPSRPSFGLKRPLSRSPPNSLRPPSPSMFP
eukprot:1152176-Prorocentrum_minimum.AAC.4